MKKIQSLLLFIFYSYINYSQTNSFPLMLSRADEDPDNGFSTVCESRVNVKDERPSSCGLLYPYILYPVIIEEFDYKEELPNNWAFNFGYTADDDYDTKGNGHIWMGTSENAFANNVVVSGGKLELILKKEDVFQEKAWGTAAPRDYRFTGAALTSRFKTKQGQVKLEAKFPENNLLWLGFWKRGSSTEIDIIELFDDKIGSLTNCEAYDQMKMHIHSYIGSQKCVRGRKFNLPNSFFPNYQKYECDFTDYRIDFLFNNLLVGYANKYYEGDYNGSGACFKHGESGIPELSHGCQTMKTMDDCFLKFSGTPPRPNKWPSWLPWPYIAPFCMIDKKVDKDESFPKTQDNMDVRVSVAIRDINNTKVWDPIHLKFVTKCSLNPQDCDEIENQLYNSWNSFSDIDKTIFIDRIEIWHLINCSGNLSFNYLSQFLSSSGKTGFASGSKITLGDNLVANFINLIPGPPNWEDYPIHLLATDEIAFLDGNIEIHEGTYLRAEIINCSGTTYNERLIGNNDKTSDDLVSEEDIKEMEKKKLEEYFKEHPEMKDSLENMYAQQQYSEQLAEYYKQQNTTSLTDNGSIIVYPNPTKDILNIDMVEEDYNDILYLEITNSLGQTIKYEKTKQLNLSDYAPGMYQLKFIFSHGFIVVKSISKL